MSPESKKLTFQIALGLVVGGLAGFAVLGSGGLRAVDVGVSRSAETSATDAAPRMLELYTPWCPTCVRMRPLVEDLAARCAGEGVRIDAVDVSQDENARIAERYGVRAVPTFLFLDENGVEAGRLVGAQTAVELRRGLDALGAASCGGSVSMERDATPARKEG